MNNQLYNWNVAGHSKQLAALEEDLRGGNLPQAYLFAGPPSIGKFTLAKQLAKILQCETNGCGECQICINVSQGYHPDTLEILDDGETIKIEPMREILVKLAMTTAGKYKVFLVKNIERMTIEATNALLKTLEEPASKVIFLFTAGSLEDVLPTVLSRVRTIKFQHSSIEEVSAFLQKKFPFEAQEKLQAISNLSFGQMGRALRFMDNAEDFQQVQNLFETVQNVLRQGTVVDKFSLVDTVTKDEKLFPEFFDIFLLALRYTMLDEAEHGHSQEKLQKIVSVVQQAQEALRLQKRNVNPRLLFEHLMLQT